LLLQKRILLAYLINDVQAIERKNNSICHNCNKQGHLGFECGDDPNPSARSDFMNRPENKERKQKQRERRDRNYRKNLAQRKTTNN